MSERQSRIARLVALCADRAWLVATLGLVLAAVAMAYTVGHFAMNTDTGELISSHLPWRQRAAAVDRLFPPDDAQIVVVIDGKTPELAEQAAAALADKLQARVDLFHSVRRPDGGPFWSHNGLLYASVADVQTTMDQLVKAQPFLGPLAADPSVRGLMGVLTTALQGVSADQAKLEDLKAPIDRLADTLETLKAGKPAYFSWRTLISGGKPDPHELRHLILINPALNFSKLEAGAAATQTIRDTARGLGLDPAHGVTVRLTGPVPLQDEEFSTLTDRAWLIGGLAFGAILLMLWLAVRCKRTIAAILITTMVGLATTMAVGLLCFHRFNAISVAFIPLFVGLGIDFGIQFSVRFRSENVGDVSVRDALIGAGRGMGRSLTLAATAIASGFLAFAPTQYVGIQQLGVVAGLGMFIALGLNLTLLPALLRIVRPPSSAEPPDARAMAEIDDWVLGHRKLVLGSAIAAAAVSAALLPFLHFDFNPLHLRSDKVESVSTLLDLIKDPDQTPNTIVTVRPNLAAADALAAKVAQLPEVANARTLSNLVPSDQPQKLAIIADAKTLLDFSLNPLFVSPPPSDQEVVDSLNQTAAALRTAAAVNSPTAPDALRLAGDLDWLAKAGPDERAKVAQVLMPGLSTLLDQARASLDPQPVTLQTLPPDLVRDWMTPDGRARITITPKGDSNDNAVISRFTKAVVKLVPDATGTAIGIQDGGQTVSGAFTEAGVISFIAITLLLLIVLRKVRDVAITMAPIILTGLLTLGSCVVLGQPLNFANIIALPLLFGIGVAFHIYFVMSWRSGGSHLLTSSLARAVFFSALTTATGFGSLWASRHPGTASMGKLLMISLIWTLVSALLFQPALMGPPPNQLEPAD